MEEKLIQALAAAARAFADNLTSGNAGNGASAPLKELLKKFGFTADAVVAAAKEQVARAKG